MSGMNKLKFKSHFCINKWNIKFNWSKNRKIPHKIIEVLYKLDFDILIKKI